MSKKKRKYDNLPKLQSKIVLCLAKEGPMIVRETNSKISGEYTSTNRAFHDLVDKGLIERAGEREYRKRVFPKYWLSVRGAGWALLNGIKAEYVKENALKTNKNEFDRKAIESFFKLRESAGPEMSRILDEFMFQQGKLETRELLKTLLPRMLSLDTKEIDSVMAAARKEEYWNYTKATLEKMGAQIRRMLSHE